MLYEDDAVVALNKPAKMLAVPTDDSDPPVRPLSSFGRTGIEEATGLCRTSHRSSHVRDSALCKNRPDREALVQQFIRHTPVREYLAAVRGHLRLKEGTLVHYFRQEGMFQRVTTESDPKSARAELRYSVEHRLKGAIARPSLAGDRITKSNPCSVFSDRPSGHRRQEVQSSGKAGTANHPRRSPRSASSVHSSTLGRQRFR